MYIARIKYLAVIALTVSLAISGIPAFSLSIAGTKCTKAGATKVSANVKYTCIKSGSKLIWNKGVAIKTPSKSTEQTPKAPETKPIETKVDDFCSSGDQGATKQTIAGILTCKIGIDNKFRWTLPTLNTNENTNTNTSSTNGTNSSSGSNGQTQAPSPDEINGQSCTEEKKTLVNSAGEYMCLKSNDGILRWAKNNRFSDPTPRQPLPPITYQVNTYAAPKYAGTSIDKCKMIEMSNQGTRNGDGLSSGFPFMPRYQSYPKTMTMALVPIDFEDLPGETNYKSRVTNQMELLSEWYHEVSGGKLTIKWVANDGWIRLPGKSSEYAVANSGKYPETEDFWKKVIPVIDSKFDLTGVQTAILVLPAKQQIVYESVQSFSYVSEMKKYNSNKTNLISFALAGRVFEAPDSTYWSYWAHEFGHQIGLAHIGESRGELQPMMGLDLLGDQNGPYRELSGWMRFIIGWLDDNQVHCQDVTQTSPNEISLVPLKDSKSGIKTVIIPTSADKAIVVDSIRPTKFGCNIPNLPGGVLVYTYDAKLGNQSHFLNAFYPADRKPMIRCEVGFTYPDFLLHTGDSVTVNGYKITVNSSGTFDKIIVAKVG